MLVFMSPPCGRFSWLHLTMLNELRGCGIYDDVAQWQSLDDLLHSLTTFSTCWNYCFPGLPPPSIPVEEYESITQLPWLSLILEVLVVVRIALQIPNCAMSNSHHTVANRYELHRCRCTAYLLISFLQRLISQDHGYFPPFFEVLHFYKTSLLCEITHSTFADTRHLRSLRARFPDLYDFIHDPGHHQQPCVYIRLSPWHTPYYVGATDQDVLRREHSRSRKFLQLLRGRHAFFELALHYWKRSNTYWIFCAVPVEIKLPVSSVWVQESKWQYLLRPHLNAPWVHRILRKVGFREHLVDFRRHSLSSPTSLGLHKRFRRRLHPDLQRQLRPDALDDIQAHYSILYQLGSNTGASFQVMRDLLSAAFPPTQLYYLLRLAVFVNEPFRSKAQKLLNQVLRKRRLQPPSTLTQLLLPPLHVQNWKALLGTWLQNWIASHRDLFPSLFIPKIRVVETRSATLGDKIYNYRTWQREWTPDTSFPCRCLDIEDHHPLRAHGHAVMVDDFSRINADINVSIMAASMKDQFFGDVDLLHQRFTTQLRKLARRWHVHGSDLLPDLQPVVAQLMETHRINLQDQAYWSSASLQRTVASLSSWVVIPADHFPSRAHVVCPSLFAILMRKTFCVGDVFSLCRESAASFRSEVVTTVPSLIRQRYAWGLRLQAPLPTARILPKPTKDWQKARPIISFFRTWAAPFLTVFGALIFELTKAAFPDIAGQLPVQELILQLWDALSKADPDEYIHLVSQDLSGFFTSIPTERFHQALQVLLHRYDQVVGLRSSSQWSVYEVKSDHRRRMFKGKWRRQTKIPRIFREQDLRYLLDFVIDNSHFEINGYLFRQERGVAMGSPAAPPLCNLVATVEDFFWHQTMISLRFRMPDIGVIWHERYVDNRFILLRDSAPHSPVLMNFLSLEFYRPPVMLEVQHDDKVLGYRCDSSSRTITPQLPDHPSQIKGIRSANDRMFTYSSWSSRSWLIIRGAQPAVQQQHGLDALKRLYEAKGFESHLLRDVRRRLGTKSACAGRSVSSHARLGLPLCLRVVVLRFACM